MDYLSHHGIKGQEWGKRRWQNTDGSYTPEGRIHYGIGEGISKVAKTAKGIDDDSGGIKSRIRRIKEKHAENRERYKRGKELDKEQRNLRSEEYTKRLKSSKKYKELTKEIDDLENRHDRTVRDDDDEETREYKRRLNDRLWNKMQDAEKIEEDIFSKAKEASAKKMIEKYGKEALSDIDYYNNTSDKRLIATFIGGFAAFSALYYMKMSKKH